VLTAANHEWAVDFANAALASGRAIRVLTTMDEYTRGSLRREVDTNIASRKVTQELEMILKAFAGLPLFFPGPMKNHSGAQQQIVLVIVGSIRQPVDHSCCGRCRTRARSPESLVT
jgi:hypothetical protein